MDLFSQDIQPESTPVEQPKSIFASIISYVFHPIFMPMAMTLLIYYFFKPEFVGLVNKVPFWLGMVFINTIMFPLLSVFLLKRLGFIKSIKMEDPKDRIIPLIIIMIFYFWAYQVFKNFNAPFLIRILFLGSFWGIIAVFMTNIFFKVSMHTAGAGGAVGIALLVLLFFEPGFIIPFSIVMLVAGLVGTARMKLGAHIALEIWLGYFLGIASQVGAYWFLK